ncbi:MAG: hypothetical protein OXG39_01820 [Chloroflexi bacterium]|nr:hypothetical protein [Chloroflexota bacterium]
MATTDIRFKRMDKEYLSLRQTQGEVFDKVDTFEAALLGLTEMVAENREMLQAIIKHLDVPYKPPAGFVKE